MTDTLLLDTHALIWLLTDPGQIPDETLARVRTRRTDLVVSSATAWEIATKHRLGRLARASGIVASYARHIQQLDARELPITSEHALLAGALAWDHCDPFDRMLVAQAMTESMTIVTTDETITAFPDVSTRW